MLRINHSLVTLIILDGWGVNTHKTYNAIALANTPNWDNLLKTSINTNLEASGSSVGLPIGQMGNSEVGHMTIGAGRIIEQDLVRINNSIINSHDFMNNKVLLNNIKLTAKNNKKIHILGLLSDGGVHSHESHLYAILQMIDKLKIPNVFIHAFLDGRDTLAKSAENFLTKLENTNTRSVIATISGRFFAMDRDNRAERTKQVYDLLTTGKTEFVATTALDGLKQAYSRSETDEFVSPTRINGSPPIENGDLVIFYNFRSDRARQLCYALTKPDFSLFTREKTPKIKLITFTKYADDLIADVIFPPINIDHTLSECLSLHKLPQLKIAETEKYPHVTFFLNGGQEASFPFEDRILIPSPTVKTYDLSPQMSALQITDELIKAIYSKKYSLIVCNFANADMVGHTGNMKATINAIETLYSCFEKIITTISNTTSDLIITADHGNAELMYDINNKQASTTHTTLPVPFIYVGNKKVQLNSSNNSPSPGLQDLAPTILKLLGLKKPRSMTGNSLLTV